MRICQNVIPYKRFWAIKGEGNKKITKKTFTQKEAIKIARKIAKNQRSGLLIYGKDGSLRDVISYSDESIFVID